MRNKLECLYLKIFGIYNFDGKCRNYSKPGNGRLGTKSSQVQVPKRQKQFLIGELELWASEYGSSKANMVPVACIVNILRS